MASLTVPRNIIGVAEYSTHGGAAHSQASAFSAQIIRLTRPLASSDFVVDIRAAKLVNMAQFLRIRFFAKVQMLGPKSDEAAVRSFQWFGLAWPLLWLLGVDKTYVSAV
jgi:hypothetical protein